MNDVIFSDVLLVPFRFRSFPSSSGPSWPVTPWQWSLATLLGTKLRCRPMFSPFPLTFLWATSMIDVLLPAPIEWQGFVDEFVRTWKSYSLKGYSPAIRRLLW